MKLFFASDLHGCSAATQKVIDAYRQSGAQHLILLGDTLNHGPRNPVPKRYNPPVVAELLNEVAKGVIAVRGNCDSEVDQMLLDFPMMTEYAWVLLESGQRLFLTHGHLYNANTRPPLKEDDVICHGHTHIPVAEKENGIFVFNPGSVTFPRNDFPASYGVFDNGTLSVISFEGETLKTCRI